MSREVGLGRLQMICRYGSYVLLILLAFVLMFTVLITTLLFLPDISQQIFEINDYASITILLLSVIILVVISFFILLTTYMLLSAIGRGRTPFTIQNVKSLKLISLFLLLSGVVSSALNVVIEKVVASNVVFVQSSVDLTPIFAAIIVYCLALIFQYGVGLQEESDQTL